MKRNRTHGFISIEITATIIVLMSLMGIGFQWIDRAIATRENQAIAMHARQVIQAASHFIKNNNSTVLAAANPTVTYTLGDIAAYLPQNLSMTNDYQQSYSIRVYKNAAGKLETMVVTTGGTALSDRNALEVAQLIGGNGGYIASSATSQVKGSFGGWNMAFTNYGSSPGAGHIAGALFFDDDIADQSGDFLYRSAVTGHPEYNVMSTALNMNNNNITAAGTVSAQNLSVAQNINTAGETFTGGWFRSTANAATGWYHEVFGGGIYMSDTSWVRVYNNKNFYTGGQIKGGSLQSDGDVNISGYTTALKPYRATSNDWAMLSYDAGSGANAAPGSYVGSAYLNDVYLRSVGKWASQLNPTNWYTAVSESWQTTGWIWNNSNNTQTVTAFEGKDISVAGDNSNSCNLFGYVNNWGNVAADVDNGRDAARWCTITFNVPPGTAWQVTSNPYPTNNGHIRWSVYQH